MLAHRDELLVHPSFVDFRDCISAYFLYMKIELPAVVDPIGQALHFLRMSGTFYCRSVLRTPWALAIPPMPDCLMLRVLTVGRCFVEVQAVTSNLIQPGDLVLIPHGEEHVLTSASGMPAAKLF